MEIEIEYDFISEELFISNRSGSSGCTYTCTPDQIGEFVQEYINKYHVSDE